MTEDVEMTVDPNNSSKSASVLGKRPRDEAREQPKTELTGVVLVALDRNEETGETRYGTIEKLGRELGHAPTKDELDQRAVLIQTATGTFLNKPAVYDLIYKDRSHEGDFAQDMAKIGLSDKPMNEVLGAELHGEDRFLETRSGKRYLKKNYENLEANGYYNADVLVQSKDGTFRAYNPKIEGKVSYEVLLQDNEKVYLRTPKGNNYIDTETHNGRKGDHAAERLYARYSGEVFHNERPDMPNVFYRAFKKDEQNRVLKDNQGNPVLADVYLSKKEFEKNFGKLDVEKTDVLFQSPHGRGLLSGKQYMNSDPDGFNEFKNEHNLSEDFRFKFPKRNTPELLIHSKGKLLTPEIAKSAYTSAGISPPTENSLSKIYGSHEIYIQNKTARGLTGNFRDAILAEHHAGNKNGRLPELGVTTPVGQTKLGEALAKIDVLSSNLERNPRTFDASRDNRGREGREAA